MSIPEQMEISKNIGEVIKRMKGISRLEQRGNSFVVIAVRCNSSESIGKRKLVPGEIYYLLDGYSVDGDVCVTLERHNLNNLYDDYMITDASGQPHIQISAIVGQNGSGKSSLVEFIMRLINNFAAMTFGELKFGSSAERLHFINGVQGDLWYIVDNNLYQLHVENSEIALYLLCSAKRNSTQNYINRLLFKEGNRVVLGPVNILARISENRLREIFSNFFYTLISNHSLYAYNSNDFWRECDTDEKERLVSACHPKEKFTAEQRCWLHGLFHKNDGYQTPMVITPFRSEGNININRENSLARERLISLLVRHDGFRKINEHLIAYSLSYGVNPHKKYGIDKIREDLGMNRLTDDGYCHLRTLIIELWGDAIGADLTRLRAKPFYNLAIEYLVFKTLKIAYTYRQHNDNFKLLSDIEDCFNSELVEDMVSLQIKDLSHITRKIHQTLAYLIYDVYSVGIEDEVQLTEIYFEEINKRWKDNVFPELQQTPDFILSTIKTEVASQALLPPPFLRSELNLRETSDLNARVDFETLSSGEKQQIYAVSSIIYHIDNLNSVKGDKSNSYRIPYRNVFLILEEVELYFHPELQQQFIKYLLDGIRQIGFSNIEGIHIILVTHSPYVLSDIPKENVLALTKEGKPANMKLKSFCGNIHEMLKDSFFLSHGSQGDFAQWEIGHLMACIDIHRKYKAAYANNLDDNYFDSEKWQLFIDEISKDESNVYRFAHRYISRVNDERKSLFFYDDFCLDFSEEKLRQRIAIIDEPLVRSILLKELVDVFTKTEEERRLAKINELEHELKRLREG